MFPRLSPNDVGGGPTEGVAPLEGNFFGKDGPGMDGSKVLEVRRRPDWGDSLVDIRQDFYL